MDLTYLFHNLRIHIKKPTVEMRMVLLDAFWTHVIISIPFFVRHFHLSRVFFVLIFMEFRIPQDNISPADKCKIWPNCAFQDKSVKFGRKLEHILTNVFSYRAIADLSRDPSCIHLLSDVINSIFLPFVQCFSAKDIKHSNKLAIYINQTAS